MTPRQTLKQLLQAQQTTRRPRLFRRSVCPARAGSRLRGRLSERRRGGAQHGHSRHRPGHHVGKDRARRAGDLRGKHSYHRRCRHRLRQRGELGAHRARVRARRRRGDPYRRSDHAQTLRPLGRQRSDTAGRDGKETASRAGGAHRSGLLHHRPHRRARRQRFR